MGSQNTYGETLARYLNNFWEALSPNAYPNAGTFANAAALAACSMPSSRIADGASYVTGDGARWTWSASSTATADNQLVVAMADAPTAGRWLRACSAGASVDLKIAVDHTTADAAVLFTVPTGVKLRVARAFWEVSVGFTGGTNSAIGMSSSNASYSTKGDVEGGSGGDLTALIGSAGYFGANGAKVGGAGPVVLVAGDTIRFDRIASNYTAGSGFAHIVCEVLA